MGWLPLAINAWTPILLPGLVAWYKATDGVYVDAGVTLATNGQTVQQWNDQSVNNNHLKQATGANRPTYQSSGFNSSFPTLNFTVAGSTWMTTTANSVVMGTGLVGSAFGVGQVRSLAPPNARALSYIENGQTDDTFSSHSAAWILTTSGNSVLDSYRAAFFAADTNFPPATNFRFGNIYDNTNNTNYINNVAGTPVAATSLTWTSPGTITVGAQTVVPTSFWDGPISELIVTNSALSSGDRLSLDTYFKTKWGL